MTSAQRFVRHAVLVAPLVLVNAAAVYGQVQWATENLTRGGITQAVLFAITVESIALFLAYEAHTALLAGDASLRLRVASYLAAGLVGGLNYSHFATADLEPTAAALVFGALSSISPWLWSIRSRSLRRDQLRASGLIDPRSARFAAAKWMNFPVHTLRAYRWSVDHGVQEERASWEACRATRRPVGEERRSRSQRGVLNGKPSAPGTTSQTAGNGQKPVEIPNMQVATRDDLLQLVRKASGDGQRVTGAAVGRWLGVSARTGRRRLSEVLEQDPTLGLSGTKEE